MNTPRLGPQLPRSRRTMWVIFSIGIAGIVVGIWLVMTMLPRWLGSEAGTKTTPATAAGEARKIHATLFYVAGDGSADLPLMQNRPANRVLAYVCQAYMCAEPTTDPDRLRELLSLP